MSKRAKVYRFKYSNIGEKLASGFFSFMGNFAYPIVTFYVILIAISLSGIAKHFNIEILTVIMMALLGVAILLGIIFALKFCFCFKGVVLFDTYLEITTQTLGFGKSRPKIEINYSDIASVFNSTFNLRYDIRKAKRTFIAGNLSNYIELTLKNGKQFCFSVDNQKDFLDELLMRIDDNKEQR